MNVKRRLIAGVCVAVQFSAPAQSQGGDFIFANGFEFPNANVSLIGLPVVVLPRQQAQIQWRSNDNQNASCQMTQTGSLSNAIVTGWNGVHGDSGLLLVQMPNAPIGTTIALQVTCTGENGAATGQMSTTVVNNLPPILTFTDPPNQTINEDTSSDLIRFAVDDPDNTVSAGSISVTALSSNPVLVSAVGISLGGAGTRDRTVQLTPNSDQVGKAIITITLSDNLSVSSYAFSLTVNAVNDAPTFNAPATIALASNTPLTLDLPFASEMSPGGGIDEGNQSLFWLPMLLGLSNSGSPIAGDILGNPAVLPVLFTNSAPNQNAANLILDLRDIGNGQAAAGYVCMRARLRDNGAPHLTSIRPVCLTVGIPACPVSCN